ncbi:hypothetical protein ACH46L_13690 [Streptomyces althioticus]|uniref:hypothetical protein n=1 Tax=Streptomyces althioticus TaxID=83380 RepID=UPI0037B65D59
MEDRTPAALGLDVVPRERPLEYPGAWPRESGLLDGDRLLPLDRWAFEDRVPVISIGSNACPGQLRHKPAGSGITAPLPMVRVRVRGVGIGVSAHLSLMGYVSNSPVVTPGRVSELFVLWLDARQLTVIDASEGVPLPHGNFRRAWLPAPDVRIELPDGSTLPGAYAYVNRRGVLHDGTGTPRTHPGQRPLLTNLLATLPRLRDLFGTTPEEFAARASADRSLCEKGTRLFAEEGLVTTGGLERYITPDGARAPARD